ncbi:MAG: type II toxin-antitoxin system HicA family toxin [Oceanipulchritudo sp.]
MKVRNILRELKRHGWRIVRVRGSHRQLKHSSKPGTVTVSGHPRLEIPPGTLKSIKKQAGLD